MENEILKKRLNTYKSDGGRLTNVDDEVVIGVLRAWENWQGRTSELYRELGLSKMQLVVMIKKAKKLVKKGAVTGSDFKEITVGGLGVGASGSGSAGYGMELSWDNGRIIRFSEVEQLIDFLKRSQATS